LNKQASSSLRQDIAYCMAYFMNRFMTIVLAMLLAMLTINQPICAQQNNTKKTPTKRQLTNLNSGGDATHHGKPQPKSFSQPVANMPVEKKAQFEIGDSLFTRSWLMAPSSVRSSDGLGPLFNARACQSCHIRDGRGHLPANTNDTATSAVVKLAREANHRIHTAPSPRFKVHADPHYGFQIQDFTAPTVPMEAGIVVHFSTIARKLKDEDDVILRYPVVYLKHLGYGPLAEDTALSLRIAPPVIGLGLLENIYTSEILKRADPWDLDGDGISGRPSWVKLQDKSSYISHLYHLGRFGWKATKPSLNEQNLAAFFNDMGMNSKLHPKPQGDCTDTQEQCLAFAALSKKPHKENIKKKEKFQPLDVDEQLAELVLFYTQTIAPPARRIPSHLQASILKGEDIFYDIGCESCHRASFTTGSMAQERYLWRQEIFPYTDMLLHDMGYELDDGMGTPHAASSEWRTAPLWGLGYTKIVSQEATFLHDGRAQTIEEAILWHGGEGLTSRQKYQYLLPKERDHLLNFLNSL